MSPSLKCCPMRRANKLTVELGTLALSPGQVTEDLETTGAIDDFSESASTRLTTRRRFLKCPKGLNYSVPILLESLVVFAIP